MKSGPAVNCQGHLIHSVLVFSTQLGALTLLNSFNVANNPCLYGALVSIGHSVRTTYSTYGTALGTWSVPASCNLTMPPTPPPAPPSPPSPPSPPPSPPPPAASSNDRVAMTAISASWCV